MDDTVSPVHAVSAFAPNGFLVIADTNQHVATSEATIPSGSKGWSAVQALGGDVVFAAGTAGGTGISGLATKTLSNNGILYGPFGAIKLTSGTLVAYWDYPQN